MVDACTYNQLPAEMKEGELLLWTGKPNLECYFSQRKKRAVLIFLGGTLFSWIAGFASFAVNEFAFLTIPLFVLGVFSLLFMKVSSRNRVAPQWWYAVTDKRILSNYPTEDVEIIWQLPLAGVRKMSVRKHTQTAGTIEFNSTFMHQNCIPFECIEDAEVVYSIIEEARLSASSISK